MSKLDITKDIAVSITESLPVGVFVTDNNGEVVYANPKANDIFGFPEEEILGYLVEDLMPESFRNAHRVYREKYVASPTNIAMSSGRILSGLKKNGEKIELQLGLNTLSEEYTLVSFIELTNEVLKPSSSNDPLTGLPNRKLFDEFCEKLRKLAIRDEKDISVLFVDLDNFKSVNDQFGHDVGDIVICEVAKLLKEHLRESDIIARVGGDEFVICLYGIGSRTSLKKVADTLLRKISSVNNVGGNPIDIGASIGAAISHSPESEPISELVHMADKLMYEAKRSGKGKVIIHEV